MRFQGIKKYLNLESYIAKCILYKKELIEDIIGENIENLHMEVRINKKRIDLIGKVVNGSLVFIEISIRYNNMNTFKLHRDEVLNVLQLVGKYKFAEIILISPQFLNNDIREIEHCIALYNVKVYFVQISKELIFNLENSTDMKNIIESSKLEFSSYLSVTSKNLNKNELFLLPLDGEKNGKKITHEILKGLREKLDWYIPLHRYKDLSKNIIKIGGGITDVMFFIYCNKEDKIKIEIDFAKRFDIFNIFKNYLADMSNHISYPICVSGNKATIYSDIPINSDKNLAKEIATDVAKDYIEYVIGIFDKIEL